MTWSGLAGGILLLMAWCLPASSAPLDGLLRASGDYPDADYYIEVGGDVMSGPLDFWRVRANDKRLAGTLAGDYQGGHISGGMQLLPGLWLSGAYWDRTIRDVSDPYHYNSGAVAIQYRFFDGQEALPALALRFSSWGNWSDAVASSTPVKVNNVVLDTVKITLPGDSQLQADLIGTWNLSPSTSVTLLASGGTVQLGYGALTATTTLDACSTELVFNQNSIFGQCVQKGVIKSQFFDSSGEYGVDVVKELAWRGVFTQLGANVHWRYDNVTLRAAYLYYSIQRDAVDQILAARGKKQYVVNEVMTLDAGYQLHKYLSVYGRGEFMTHLFFNDVPVMYNSSSSSNFARKYSLFSFGLRSSF
jgi:hypothetical protein